MRKGCIIRQGYFDDVRVRKEALALIDKGYKVDLICLRKEIEKRKEVLNNINIYRISINRSRRGIARYLFEYITFFILSNIKLCSLYLRKRYDFIQVNTLPDFLVFVTIVPKIFGAKVVLDLHEPSPELFSTIFGENRILLIKLITFFEKISIRYADRVITVSEQMRRNYIKRGGPPSKIEVVLNVPNLEFNPDLYEEKLRNDDKFLLVCHGAMFKRYGQDVLIKSIEIVKDKIHNIQLNILGYGDYEPVFKKLTSQLKLNEYIHFLGFIPFLDMIKMIAKSDIGIVPIEKNSYSDLVHTNKMFEFIAMKRPVIISRTKAVEDFFGSDDSCLKYFESGDEKDLAKCIIELYNSPEKRQKMVNNALEKFESVHWEITKKDYCQIFEQLLNK